MPLSAARRRFTRGVPKRGFVPAAASQNFYAGGLLGANAAGAGVPMGDSTGHKFLGVLNATTLLPATGTRIEYEYDHEEWFPILSGTITQANVGFGAVALEDGGLTDAATAAFDRVIGRLVELETRLGVAGAWVHVRGGMEARSIPGAQTTELSGPIRVSNIPIGPVALASLGTSAVHVAGSIYLSEIQIPVAMRATGINILNGVTVGTDNLIVGLYAANGALVANSALAGTLSAGANGFQQIAFTAPVDIAPGRYFVALQANGTTATTRRIATATFLNAASVQAGVFGTLPATLTTPTTTTADAGPIAFVY